MNRLDGYEVKTRLCITTLSNAIALAFFLFTPSVASAQYDDLDPSNWFPLELGNYWYHECCGEPNFYGWVTYSERDTVVNDLRWVFMKVVYWYGPSRAFDRWVALTDDFYVWDVRGDNVYGDTLIIPPTIPYSALLSTENDDTTFTSMRSGANLTASFSNHRYNGSTIDSTDLVLSVYNPVNVFDFGATFYYKIGSNYTGRLIGAKVNGHEWGEQRSIDWAISLPIDDEAPSGYGIAVEAYPSPFSQQTNIAYQLPNHDYVKIVIWDAAGRAVRTLVRQDKLSGSHTVTWNGRSDTGAVVGSGLYFVRLDTGGRSAVRAMILSR